MLRAVARLVLQPAVARQPLEEAGGRCCDRGSRCCRKLTASATTAALITWGKPSAFVVSCKIRMYALQGTGLTLQRLKRCMLSLLQPTRGSYARRMDVSSAKMGTTLQRVGDGGERGSTGSISQRHAN